MITIIIIINTIHHQSTTTTTIIIITIIIISIFIRAVTKLDLAAVTPSRMLSNSTNMTA